MENVPRIGTTTPNKGKESMYAQVKRIVEIIDKERDEMARMRREK